HPRESEQVADAGRREAGVPLAQLRGAGEQALDQLLVEAGIGPEGFRAQADAALDLAATSGLRHRGAKCGLGRPQLVRHPEGEVEIAGIDAAPLDRELAEGRLAGAAGVAGHALDAVCPRRLGHWFASAVERPLKSGGWERRPMPRCPMGWRSVAIVSYGASPAAGSRSSIWPRMPAASSSPSRSTFRARSSSARRASSSRRSRTRTSPPFATG